MKTSIELPSFMASSHLNTAPMTDSMRKVFKVGKSKGNTFLVIKVTDLTNPLIW